MADILEEVLNEQKEEKRLIIFRKALPIIIISTIIIAIFISLFNWYQAKKIAYNQESGNLLIELITKSYDKNLTNSSLHKIVEDNKNKQAELAALKLVSNKIRENNIEGALLELQNISKNSGYHKITTSYAKIMWISLILDKAELSEQEQILARDYLQYFTDEKQEFFTSAILLKAFFYKKINQFDLAKEYAMKVTKLERAPVAIKEQAKALISILK